jgi:hypothetical protein
MAAVKVSRRGDPLRCFERRINALANGLFGNQRGKDEYVQAKRKQLQGCTKKRWAVRVLATILAVVALLSQLILTLVIESRLKSLESRRSNLASQWDVLTLNDRLSHEDMSFQIVIRMIGNFSSSKSPKLMADAQDVVDDAVGRAAFYKALSTFREPTDEQVASTEARRKKVISEAREKQYSGLSEFMKDMDKQFVKALESLTRDEEEVRKSINDVAGWRAVLNSLVTGLQVLSILLLLGNELREKYIKEEVAS